MLAPLGWESRAALCGWGEVTAPGCLGVAGGTRNLTCACWPSLCMCGGCLLPRERNLPPRWHKGMLWDLKLCVGEKPVSLPQSDRNTDLPCIYTVTLKPWGSCFCPRVAMDTDTDVTCLKMSLFIICFPRELEKLHIDVIRLEDSPKFLLARVCPSWAGRVVGRLHRPPQHGP